MMCSKCKEIKNVSAFQGYKTCNMCRETARKYKDKYYFCDMGILWGLMKNLDI